LANLSFLGKVNTDNIYHSLNFFRNYRILSAIWAENASLLKLGGRKTLCLAQVVQAVQAIPINIHIFKTSLINRDLMVQSVQPVYLLTIKNDIVKSVPTDPRNFYL
jgi:hypothetical protein